MVADVNYRMSMCVPAGKLHVRADLLLEARVEHHIIDFCDEEDGYSLETSTIFGLDLRC